MALGGTDQLPNTGGWNPRARRAANGAEPSGFHAFIVPQTARISEYLFPVGTRKGK